MPPAQFCVLLCSHEFDSEQLPELSVRDIHSVSSVCKMYFRELPNPLLTTQLYDKFTVSTGQCLGKDMYLFPGRPG